MRHAWTLLIIGAVVVASACSSKSERSEKRERDEAPDGGVTLSKPNTAITEDTLKAGDVRIVTTNGGVDLALIGDSISSGLSPEALARGVITYSSGNHGQAVALAGSRLGAPAVIVMPTTTPAIKVEGVKRWGGEAIFEGTTSNDRRARAEKEAAARGLTMVPPFDHEWIIEGQGTCGLEILEQVPDADIVALSTSVSNH